MYDYEASQTFAGICLVAGNQFCNLLFISKYPEIIHEFTDAMKDRDIEIETAINGIEAAAKIKKKNYDIVITGLSLEGYNGEQIITYLNKTAPSTACIIYTTTISSASPRAI